MNNKITFKNISITISCFWLFIFVLIPNGLIFITTFLSKDPINLISTPFTIKNYAIIFDYKFYSIMLNSIYLAGKASILCLIIGYPTAWALAQCKTATRNFIITLIILPLWVNSLIKTYAIKTILSKNGYGNMVLLKLGIIDEPMNLLYNDTAMVIGFVYLLLPLMILPLYVSISNIPRIYKEAAKDLGANNLYYFAKIMVPLTYSGIVSGFLLVFLPAIGMFYLAELLGGSKNILIGSYIKNQMLTLLNWPVATTASCGMILIMFIFIYIYKKSEKQIGKSDE